jgi:hypothetical protein
MLSITYNVIFAARAFYLSSVSQEGRSPIAAARDCYPVHLEAAWYIRKMTIYRR